MPARQDVTRLRPILFGILAPSFLVGALALLFVLTFTDNVGGLLRSKVEMTVINVEERVESALARDLAIGEMFAARPHLLSMLKQGNMTTVQSHLEFFVEHLAQIERVTIVNTRGIQVANYPLTPETLGMDFSHRDYFVKVSQTWEPHVSEFFMRVSPPQRYVFTISVPLIYEGTPLGVLNIQPHANYFGNRHARGGHHRRRQPRAVGVFVCRKHFGRPARYLYLACGAAPDAKGERFYGDC
ncbi:MAG: hypothetical protein KGZ66_11550 [Selenomonadales bacterium]|nr:hypothetical protein [Selenomonadales bacterium]